MKHPSLIVLLAVVFLPPTLAAQEPAPAAGEEAAADEGTAGENMAAGEAMPAVDEEAVHDALRALRDQAIDAINRSDVDALLALLDDDVVFTPLNGEVARGKDEIRDYFDKMMVGPDRIVESMSTDMTVDTLSILHGDDTAIAYGSSRDRYRLTSGLDFEVSTRWTATLVLEGDRWLIAAFHSSANLFDNPLLKRAQRTLYWGVGGALALGLLVGWVIGRRRSGAANA